MLTWPRHTTVAKWSSTISWLNAANLPKCLKCPKEDWGGHWSTLNLLSYSWNQFDTHCSLWHAGNSHYKMSKLGPLRDACGQQQYSDRLWHSSSANTRGPNGPSAKITLLTPLHHIHQHGLLTQSRLRLWIHASDSKFWPYNLHITAEIEIRHTRCFSNLHLSSFSESVHIVASGFCSWSRCLFWNGFLNSTVVKSGYLNCLSLPVSSNQCGISLQQGISATPWMLFGFFFLPFCVSPGHSCGSENRDQEFQKYLKQNIWHQ